MLTNPDCSLFSLQETFKSEICITHATSEVDGAVKPAKYVTQKWFCGEMVFVQRYIYRSFTWAVFVLKVVFVEWDMFTGFAALQRDMFTGFAALQNEIPGMYTSDMNTVYRYHHKACMNQQSIIDANSTFSTINVRNHQSSHKWFIMWSCKQI